MTGIAFATLFPITFAASTFVPLTRQTADGTYEPTMPPVLQTIAEWNPVTTLANALRKQFGNPVADQGPAVADPARRPLHADLGGGDRRDLRPARRAGYARSIRK